MNNKIKFVDLQTQYQSIKFELQEVMMPLLENASFIKGKPVADFENAFSKFCESKSCVGVGNGTDALSLALRAMNIGSGDEVITVGHTFIATAEAITSVGATPVFIDIRNDTMLMNPDLIESAISPNTKAIMPVHLYGNPCEMDHICDIAHEHNIRVIEDAAQAHGARWKGRRIGSWGDAACFSFYPGKNLGAYGDGGAVVSKDDEFIQKVRMLADHGRKEKYIHEFPGYNSRLDTLQAAILNVKLKYLEAWNECRCNHANEYIKQLSDTDLILPQIHREAQPVWHLFVIRCQNRELLRIHLRETGVETGVHYPVPVHRQPAYHEYSSISLPVTEKAANEVLSLPMYPELGNEIVHEVCNLIKKYNGM